MIRKRLRHAVRALRMRDPFDLAAMLLLAALVVLVGMTFRDYAISNDEEVQHRYGELIVAYYASGFSDDTVFHYKNLYLYGGLFDIVAVLLAKMLPVEPYALRHVLSALIGVGGIAATWATGRLVAGPRAGLIAAVALAVWGPWYGGMFNHTKDVPFAAAMIAAVYFLLCAARDLPRPRWRDVVLFGVMMGCALGLRAMGLLLVFYAGLAVLLQLSRVEDRSAQGLTVFLTRSTLVFVPSAIIAYAIMIAAWPWAWLEWLNPVRAVFAFAHFHYPIGTLVLGTKYDMADVPRWYVPLYFLVKLSLPIAIGALLAAGLAAGSLVSGGRRAIADMRLRETALLIVMAVFPLMGQVIFHGPAFTGLRHYIYVVPILAVLTGDGADSLLLLLEERRRALAAGALAVMLAGLAWNAVTLLRLHPHQYLFFNPLVGGLEGASRRYDTDYWVNIMPEAVRELEAYVRRIDPEGRSRYTVGVCGERLAYEKQSSGRLQWTPDWKRSDFFIAPTHMNCDQVLRGRTVKSIDRLGVTIGVVKDLRGYTATQRGFPPDDIARAP
jgi:hypothetical protein